jgi:hypothetical protein
MSVDGLNNMYSSFNSESNHKTELRPPLSETYFDGFHIKIFANNFTKLILT